MTEDQLSFSGATGLSAGRSQLQEGLAKLLEFLVDAPLGAVGLPINDSGASRAGELLGAATGSPAVMKAIAVLAKRLPIRAYHGSPHDFDKFDLSRIGTGEGAQAYGHGLYFAESPEVATSYRAAGQPTYRDASRVGLAKRALQEAGGDRLKAIEIAHNYYLQGVKHGMGEPWRDVVNNFDALVGPPPGRMYEVNIHADPEDFLDWDAPLSQQSEKVRQQLKESGLAHPQARAKERGEVIYRKTADASSWDVGRPNAWRGATEQLRNAGIPGIKYLDQGSRAAGQGTRNYVVFDDKLIEIVKKYGIAAAIGAGLINEGQARQLREQGYQ